MKLKTVITSVITCFSQKSEPSNFWDLDKTNLIISLTLKTS
ncbi:MAG: hypothetical protein QNK33_09455 [Bacteroidales bacterium]|nr:hypothetical protein [Bacteroidales bacterium]